MATIPTPPTFAAGDTTTVAGNLNLLRDCINFWSQAPKCYCYQTTTTTFGTSGTYALVGLDTDLYNTDGPGSALSLHSTSTNNSRIVAQTAGKYRITGQVSFASNVTGARFISVRKNAAGVIGGGTQLGIGSLTAVNGGPTTVAVEPFTYPLSAGDYIEIFGMQTSGGSLASVNTSAGTFLSIELVAA